MKPMLASVKSTPMPFFVGPGAIRSERTDGETAWSGPIAAMCSAFGTKFPRDHAPPIARIYRSADRATAAFASDGTTFFHHAP